MNLVMCSVPGPTVEERRARRRAREDAVRALRPGTRVKFGYSGLRACEGEVARVDVREAGRPEEHYVALYLVGEPESGYLADEIEDLVAPKEYVMGLAPRMGVGGKRHAVEVGARPLPSPRPVRHEGYQAIYRALCGTLVYTPWMGGWSGRPEPFEPGRPGSAGSCKSCTALSQADTQ